MEILDCNILSLHGALARYRNVSKLAILCNTLCYFTLAKSKSLFFFLDFFFSPRAFLTVTSDVIETQKYASICGKCARKDFPCNYIFVLTSLLRLFYLQCTMPYRSTLLERSCVPRAVPLKQVTLLHFGGVDVLRELKAVHVYCPNMILGM